MRFVGIEKNNETPKVYRVHLGDKNSPKSIFGDGDSFESAVAVLKTKISTNDISFVDLAAKELSQNPDHGRYYFDK